MTKKHITVNLETVEFYGDLDESIKLLQNYKQEHSKDYDRLYLDGNMESYQFEDCDHYVLRLKGTRLENDAEYATRLAEEAARKVQMEEREKLQYEALRKKFEGT